MIGVMEPGRDRHNGNTREEGLLFGVREAGTREARGPRVPSGREADHRVDMRRRTGAYESRGRARYRPAAVAASRRLGRTADLLRYRLHRLPQSGVLVRVLLEEPHRRVPDFSRISRRRVAHCSILSRNGASGKPGAVHAYPSRGAVMRVLRVPSKGVTAGHSLRHLR